MEITAAWLDERGGLHDAKILDLVISPASVRITIHDEWVGLVEPAAPPSKGTLVFEKPIAVAGNVECLDDGWIIDVRYDKGAIVFYLSDGESVTIKAKVARWEPFIAPL